MDIRARLSEALKQAMRQKDAARLSTLRLINAAIKDREIALRAEVEESETAEIGTEEILAILGKMSKQRQESARSYEEAGRIDLAEREEAEAKIIEEFLPRRLDDAETEEAISHALAEVDANSIRDMGKVMAVLKSKYNGRMDFAAVGPQIKNRLCQGAGA